MTPAHERLEAVSRDELRRRLSAGATVVLDVRPAMEYGRGHIAGAHWALRAQLPQALENVPVAERYVVTCGSGLLARFAVADRSGGASNAAETGALAVGSYVVVVTASNAPCGLVAK